MAAWRLASLMAASRNLTAASEDEKATLLLLSDLANRVQDRTV